MGHLNIPNFEEIQDEQGVLLQESLYTGECVDAELMKTRGGADMLMLRTRVVDGPAQEGGRSPVGTEISDFIVLDPTTAKDEKGRAFMQKKIAQVFSAFDITVVDGDYDEHEFVGKSVIIKVKPGEDGDGFPVDTIKRYKKLS